MHHNARKYPHIHDTFYESIQNPELLCGRVSLLNYRAKVHTLARSLKMLHPIKIHGS